MYNSYTPKDSLYIARRPTFASAIDCGITRSIVHLSDEMKMIQQFSTFQLDVSERRHKEWLLSLHANIVIIWKFLGKWVPLRTCLLNTADTVVLWSFSDLNNLLLFKGNTELYNPIKVLSLSVT